MEVRQLSAAMVRSGAVNCTFTSFSASTKVADETSGPTGGDVLKAGGAPAGGSPGFCALARVATAVPNKLRDAWVKNSLRDFDIVPQPLIINNRRDKTGFYQPRIRGAFQKCISA
jgi:hypothetical protein